MFRKDGDIETFEEGAKSMHFALTIAMVLLLIWAFFESMSSPEGSKGSHVGSYSDKEAEEARLWLCRDLASNDEAYKRCAFTDPEKYY